MARYRYCPAVSKILSLTMKSSISNILVKKSMPVVALVLVKV